MATYVNQDLASTHEGDLVLDGKGDIKIADALETHKKAANFLLRTDRGDYAPNELVGCSLGSFIGELNTSENHSQMEYHINKGLRDEVFSKEDVASYVVPFDYEEALCVVNIKGTFYISGEFVDIYDQKISYTFPYIEGQPSPLVI